MPSDDEVIRPKYIACNKNL